MSLDSLLETIAANPSDPATLDQMREFVGAAPFEQTEALFDRLDPSRLPRAVGQTLLASTRLAGYTSQARSDFLERFLRNLPPADRWAVRRACCSCW
jgi:hypothetical protein